MESRKVVLHETGVIAMGEALCLALMLGIFALAGHFDRTVVLGGVIGTLLAILNFFFMALGASMAADKAIKQDVKGGQVQIKLSYTLRMIAIIAILLVCVKSGLCNALASVLPLVFVRPVIMVAEFFRK